MSSRRIDFTTHLTDARLEDARFMLDNGASLEEAARRLGLAPETLEKSLVRHREAS